MDHRIKQSRNVKPLRSKVATPAPMVDYITVPQPLSKLSVLVIADDMNDKDDKEYHDNEAYEDDGEFEDERQGLEEEEWNLLYLDITLDPATGQLVHQQSLATILARTGFESWTAYAHARFKGETRVDAQLAIRGSDIRLDEIGGVWDPDCNFEKNELLEISRCLFTKASAIALLRNMNRPAEFIDDEIVPEIFQTGIDYLTEGAGLDKAASCEAIVDLALLLEPSHEVLDAIADLMLEWAERTLKD